MKGSSSFGSARLQLLGQADQDLLGAAQIAEAVRLLVLNDLPHHRCPVRREPGERCVKIVDGKHHAQIAERIDRIGPVIIGTDAEVGARSWGSLYGADY